MDAVDKFLDILHDWWKRYELLDPGLPLFQESTSLSIGIAFLWQYTVMRAVGGIANQS